MPRSPRSAARRGTEPRSKPSQPTQTQPIAAIAITAFATAAAVIPKNQPAAERCEACLVSKAMNEASGDAGSRVGGGEVHGSGSRVACRSPAVARSGERCSLSPLRKLRSGGRQRQRSSRRRAQGKSRRGGRSGVSATGERRRCRTHSRRPAAAAARARARGPRGRGRLLLESTGKCKVQSAKCTLQSGQTLYSSV
jgi:hypothetical protein